MDSKNTQSKIPTVLAVISKAAGLDNPFPRGVNQFTSMEPIAGINRSIYVIAPPPPPPFKLPKYTFKP